MILFQIMIRYPKEFYCSVKEISVNTFQHMTFWSVATVIDLDCVPTEGDEYNKMINRQS